MKNILIITAVFPPEPVVSAQLSFDIANELSKDHHVTVLSPKPTRPENFNFQHIESSKFGFQHVVANSFTHPKSQLIGRMRESYSFGKYAEKYIEKNKNQIDIIYINSWPLFSQYFIIKAAKKNKIKTVIHIQDIYPESLVNKLPFFKSIASRILMPMDKYILKNADKIIAISENMLKTLSEKRDIPGSKFTVVANWQNEEQFTTFEEQAKNQKTSNEAMTFMYLGNNGPVAGVEFLIESFVDAKIQNSKLVIAGSGSKTEDCKTLAKKLGATNIEFIPVPDGKVPEVQSMADVMVLPVKKGAAMSSMPSKLPAYMFSKKPIIGSLDLESDTARAITDSECGIVVEPENSEKLSAAMEEISRWDKKKLEDTGEKGFHYAMEHLSKKSNLKKVVETILDIV